MTQKILQIGSSAGVIISKKTLEELDLHIGDDIVSETDARRKRIIYSRKSTIVSDDDQRIADLTYNFIQRYRKDLEALAR
jgi:antitoxin component of MazEF toxin-antitoxin module